MRHTRLAIVGCSIGAAVGILSVYIFGLLMESLGIQLYGSEAAQQRNFNLAVSFVVVIIAIGGYLGYRRAKDDA